MPKKTGRNDTVQLYYAQQLLILARHAIWYRNGFVTKCVNDSNGTSANVND